MYVSVWLVFVEGTSEEKKKQISKFMIGHSACCVWSVAPGNRKGVPDALNIFLSSPWLVSSSFIVEPKSHAAFTEPQRQDTAVTTAATARSCIHVLGSSPRWKYRWRCIRWWRLRWIRRWRFLLRPRRYLFPFLFSLSIFLECIFKVWQRRFALCALVDFENMKNCVTCWMKMERSVFFTMHFVFSLGFYEFLPSGHRRRILGPCS